MKRNLTIAAAAIIVVSCAKSEKSQPYDDEKAFFDAWIEINHPESVPTSLGAYLIEDNESQGEVHDPEEEPYVYVRYTVTDLEGNITSTNFEKVPSRWAYMTTPIISARRLG